MFVIICYCHLQVPAANDLIALGWSWGAGGTSRMGGAILWSLLPPAPQGSWVWSWFLGEPLSNGVIAALVPVTLSKGRCPGASWS